MKYLNKEVKLCHCCMEEHEVAIVEVQEVGTYKDVAVEFTAVFEYCSNREEFSEDEDMMRKNFGNQREEYRKIIESKEEKKEV